MDDQGCPRCKTTKYRNPSLKLMVNVCGHTLCENCVEMLFVRGSGNCVQCDTPLRKSNFRVQLFEDPTVDKEVEIRKKVLKIYNKRDFDFSSLREYNDYLEQVEDIGRGTDWGRPPETEVYNLTNNLDVENTKLKMEQYQREHRDLIQKNKATLTREQEELEELLLLEQQGNEQRRLDVLQDEQRQLQAKRKNKQALLDELEQSQLPATILLAQHKVRAAQLETQIEQQKQTVKPTNLFSTGIHMRQTVSLVAVPKVEDVLFHYKPLHVETYGPPVPELEQLSRVGYLNHVRAAMPQDTAGGYTSALACHRAIQDAFSGLFPLKG
ncbi:CDK-activating kinase assembly factor MAT1 isoform X1 [Scophthalmus maximus]|uniref:CDK-activating kinase assembly factor MAT1 isoform X1 n=1 Tax=Scophthalmus maximus TaxID=52904 RepID=UPI001FA8CD36|nr:CDK-activating kinase assembly factor MAT1 isoform X1 [Scophthalmus maximus]XP_047193506.1 CDK-activating kinase assembly factor MAT1 isoform X1 [Scophthalmus maximus]XP_047193507.1 CDK-activating kinase assembly factor MAT1 isoform X1 [Scophthalmus maximus]XP_047193508.1 CDK-activating kinase assembly factor MAT1 isoform X1 [Scophthalmus maximus]XP_047193509.1 CDK-activating kinase assembly factor MAT1 isoform X1 [Scophthalmus maximus]